MTVAGKRLNLLTPMYGGMCTGTYHESVLKLAITCAQNGVYFDINDLYNESLITRARNRLIDDFIKNTTNTHALFIDADIGFDPVDILSMLELDLDIVGAACVKKSIRWDRIREAIVKTPELPDAALAKMMGDFVVNWIPFSGQKQVRLDEPQEVESLGTGLLMIKREVFLKMMDSFSDRWYTGKGDPSALPGKIFDFFRCGVNPETRVYDSEDYFFCKDARSLDFKVWLAPWVKTSHRGTFTFEGDVTACATVLGKF